MNPMHPTADATTNQSPIRARLRRLLLAGALVITGASGSGCFTQAAVSDTTPLYQGGLAASIFTAGAMGVGIGIIALDPHQSGPRVEFRNEAEVPVQVRYWVGKADGMSARGVREMRTRSDWAFVAQPGETVVVRIGRKSWNTSNADAVVWVRVDQGAGMTPPEGERTAWWTGSDDPSWYEATGTLPLVWSVSGDEQGVFPEQAGFESFISLPEELWIPGNNGDYPVYDMSFFAGK